MKAFLILAHILAFIAVASPAVGQDVVRIAAVVNDDVISVHDLAARLRLVLVSIRLPDTPDNRRRFAPQVLRSLINEKLQLQEAKRLNISVSTDEIQNALTEVEGRNNIPKGDLAGFLARQGIKLETLVHQVRSTLAWNRVLRRESRKITQVSEEEVQEALAEIEASRGQPQSLVSEIFLSVDSAEQEEELLETSRRLVEQIKAGANFNGLARQLSQSATAAVEGDIGWVQEGQLARELEEAIAELKPGEVSDPVRTVAGFHILLLRDRRVLDVPDEEEMAVTLEHVFVSLPSGPTSDDRANATELAALIGDTVTDCSDMRLLREESNAPKFGLPSKVKLKELAPKLRAFVQDLDVGVASEPMDIGTGVLVLMVCEREEAPGLPGREEVIRTISNQRVDILARRYMRDLRRAAFVDLRV